MRYKKFGLFVIISKYISYTVSKVPFSILVKQLFLSNSAIIQSLETALLTSIVLSKVSVCNNHFFTVKRDRVL
jgi:hypothetical protein